MPEQHEAGAAPADEQSVLEAAETAEAVDTIEVVEVIDGDETDASAEASVVEARPLVADEVLLASAALAQRALLEVTPPETVGSVVGHIVEDEHVLTLLFAADLAGYPGWHWSVTIARVDDAEATVLETELMPGERALVAPEWVPWSERLAEYRAAQAAAAAAAAERGELDEHDEDDFDEDDELDGADRDEDSRDDDSDDEDGSDEDADFDHADEDDEHFDDHDEVYDGIEIDALDGAQVDDDADLDDDDEDEPEDEPDELDAR